MNPTQPTPEQAIQIIAEVCSKYTGYSIQGAQVTAQALQVLAALIQPAELPTE
jgi:hypothetical protein